MLRELRIKNFKNWQDTDPIKMAPITLFFGTNSSGKSSIGQLLMMLRQTVDSQDRKAIFYPGGKNTAVQLGSYLEMVYHRNKDNKISFEYTWDLRKNIKFKDPLSGSQYQGKQLSFSATVGMTGEDHHTVVLDSFKYSLLKENNPSLSIGMNRRESSKIEYEVIAEDYHLKRNPGRVWYPSTTVRFYGFPDEVVAYYKNADFVQTLNLEQEKLFQSVFYLGPLRTKTERLYSWAGIIPEDVGYGGENAVAAMLAAQERKISLGYKRQAKPFMQLIAEKLKEMGLIEKFKVNPISETRQEYEVKVCTTGSHDFVDLPDVGFGISQVLPVLVQCFYAPQGSIIIIEQPEIHLHPSAQAALADVFIDVINSRENGKDRNIQLIIETHSEHFLRRLQRRIAENKKPKEISREDVSAYFAMATKTPAKLEPLQIDLFGNITNWPENFFGDEMGDITAQTKAAMLKRKAMIKNKVDTVNNE